VPFDLTITNGGRDSFTITNSEKNSLGVSNGGKSTISGMDSFFLASPGLIRPNPVISTTEVETPTVNSFSIVSADDVSINTSVDEVVATGGVFLTVVNVESASEVSSPDVSNAPTITITITDVVYTEGSSGSGPQLVVTVEEE
jgi:hypothetical protein